MSERIEIRHDGEIVMDRLPVAKLELTPIQASVLVGDWLQDDSDASEVEALEGEISDLEICNDRLRESIEAFLEGPISFASLEALSDVLNH